jgi:hypothetical protein
MKSLEGALAAADESNILLGIAFGGIRNKRSERMEVGSTHVEAVENAHR